MDINEIVKLSNIYTEMENTEGWQHLRRELESDIIRMIDHLVKIDDDIVRGKIQAIRSILSLIDDIHVQAEKLIKE